MVSLSRLTHHLNMCVLCATNNQFGSHKSDDFYLKSTIISNNRAALIDYPSVSIHEHDDKSSKNPIQPSTMTQQAAPFLQYWNYFKQFYNFLETLIVKSNIHGVKHIFNSKFHFIERLFWLTLVLAASYSAYLISSSQYERYVANPTVISLERDYRDWNGTLPAITVCYHRRLDEEKAEAVIKKFWNIEKIDPEYSYFLDYVRSVVQVNESYTKFNRFANDKRLEYINMLTIAKEVHPKINTVFSSFDSNAEFVLDEIITEKGVCYCVNSILAPLIGTE